MRHAFTLMELMVSIVLIALIVLFLFGAIASSKLSNDTLLKHTEKEQVRSELFELFYRDIMEAVSIQTVETKEKAFTLLQMQTSNSLYEIAMPYVTYFVHAQTHRLTRLESARKITLPIAYEAESFVMADVLLSDVSAFNVYAGTDDAAAEDNNNTQNSASIGGSSSDGNESNRTNGAVSNALAPDNNATQGNNMANSYLLYLESSELQTPFLFELYR